ncbi:TRAP transporter permease, partial [Chloroflexota bacterium]
MIALISPTIALFVAVVYVFHFTVFGLIMLDTGYLMLLVALFLPLVFIWIPASAGKYTNGLPWYDILLVLLSFVIPFYFFLVALERTIGWAFAAPQYATIMGGILWVLVVEGARRTVNNLFAVVVLVLSLYPLYGFLMPGFLVSAHFSLTRTINFHIFSDSSFMGIPLHVFGGIVIGFLVFASAIKAAGVGRFFNELSVALLGTTRGGTAKVAILASGFFGSVSGSPVANVLTTGSFTIPAMKKAGFPPVFAAAVEATASTGGSLMPPIMGASAFIMAEILQVSYAQVALAAFIPSLLYYLTLFFHIDAYAARKSLKPERILVAQHKIRWILLDNLHIIIGFAVLIYLVFALYLILWAPWFSTVIVFAIAMVRAKTRLNLRNYVSFVEDLGKNLGEMVTIMVSAGLIIGSFLITGIAFSLPYTIVSMAGGNIYLVLVLGAIAAFILGMGLPTVASYIFLAIVLVPGLIAFGLDPFASHLFVMYMAMISMITPPVCISAFTASVLAGCDAMKTGFRAMRLGIAIYFIPFFFVMNPSMILRGTPLNSLQTILTAVLGLALLSGALEGYIWRIGNINIPARVLFLASGFLLAIPTTFTDQVGAGIA